MRFGRMTNIVRRPSFNHAKYSCFAAIFLALPAHALVDLKRGDPAPRITISAIDGKVVDTQQMRGEVLLVMFGEAGQQRTERACRLIDAALDIPRLDDQRIQWILVLSKGSEVDDLAFDITEAKRPPIVVHDTAREVFGAYQTVVSPTVAVVDRRGNLVHIQTGLTPQFGDIVLDALLVGCGKLTFDQFDANLRGGSEVIVDQPHRRAERLVQLAHRLVQRNLTSLAESKYREAIELVPESIEARLGLAEALMELDRSAEAEVLFERVIHEAPNTLQAKLGLASIYLARDRAALTDAEELIQYVLAHAPNNGRAHYLLGFVHEQRGATTEAAASFKTAAQLLLEQLKVASITH